MSEEAPKSSITASACLVASKISLSNAAEATDPLTSLVIPAACWISGLSVKMSKGRLNPKISSFFLT